MTDERIANIERRAKGVLDSTDELSSSVVAGCDVPALIAALREARKDTARLRERGDAMAEAALWLLGNPDSARHANTLSRLVTTWRTPAAEQEPRT